MNSKQIRKIVQKNAKKVISESGIGSSRAGNKELSHLATRLSRQTIESIENAQILGERLGKTIVVLSQDFNKQYLDRGIIRTMVATNAVPSIEDLSVVDRIDIAAKKKLRVSKVPSSVQSSAPVQEIQAVAQIVDEPETEDTLSAIQVEYEENVDSASLSAQLVEEVEFEQKNENTSKVFEEPETVGEEHHVLQNDTEVIDDIAPEEDLNTEGTISPIESAAIDDFPTVEELSDDDAASVEDISVVEDTPVIESEAEERSDEDETSVIESNVVDSSTPTDLDAEEDLLVTEFEAVDDSTLAASLEVEKESLAEAI